MRPMYACVDNTRNAFFPRKYTGPFIDVSLSNIPHTTVIASRVFGSGYGSMPGYGTFLDIGATRYSVNRFFNTRPVPTITLRPMLNSPAKQVTSPMTLLKHPGYMQNVQYSTTAISQIVNKPYLGSPAE